MLSDHGLLLFQSTSSCGCCVLPRQSSMMTTAVASAQVSKLQQEHAASARQLAENYSVRVRVLTEEADARCKAEVAEVEDRKNAHIQVC